jgi:hypothetical protein
MPILDFRILDLATSGSSLAALADIDFRIRTPDYDRLQFPHVESEIGWQNGETGG